MYTISCSQVKPAITCTTRESAARANCSTFCNKATLAAESKPTMGLNAPCIALPNTGVGTRIGTVLPDAPITLTVSAAR